MISQPSATAVTTARSVSILFSSPGDVSTEKKKLISIVEDMRPAFLRYGISLDPWAYETEAVPGTVADGGTVQTIVDHQMRRIDGVMTYDLFVGLMDRRIGTPLPDAPSGTVHEFREAQKLFESTGRPHILFYFHLWESGDATEPNLQSEAVEQFRSEYPGLFSYYCSIEDLELQFRRHLLTELLGLFQTSLSAAPDPAWSTWWLAICNQYTSFAGTQTGYRDRTIEKVRRMLRQLHLLMGIDNCLSPLERRILCASLFSALLDLSQENIRQFVGDIPNGVAAVCSILERSRETEKLMLGSVGEVRLDLLGVLVYIAWSLDRSRASISRGITGPPDPGTTAVDDWLAWLTADIHCEHGIVRYHLLSPSRKWDGPLAGATAIALEALWQNARSVLTRYGLSFAVARCQIDIDASVGHIPGCALKLISQQAHKAMADLPKNPHLGENQLPRIAASLPLPVSKVNAPVVFRTTKPGPLRLLVDGDLVAEAPDGGRIEYLPPVDRSVECTLECNEFGEFVPIVRSRLQQLNPMEAACLDVSEDRLAAFHGLGMWNDLMEALWSRMLSPYADMEDEVSVLHILNNAFKEAPFDQDSLLDRRDLYWTAVESVCNRIVKKGEVTT
jgi:hypothetical protein